MTTFTDTWAVCNSHKVNLAVWLEPWAMDYVVKPGETLRIVGTSAKEGQFDVAEYSDRVGVYIWPGASIRVFRDGRLEDELPDILGDGPPSGRSIREFIEVAFEGPGGPRDMPKLRRFSLRNLLIATTLIAVGLGLIVWSTRG